MIEAEQRGGDNVRLKPLLKALGIAASTWYYRPPSARKRPGPPPKPLDAALKAVVVEYAQRYPWWGYKRLAIGRRRAGHAVGKKFVYAVFKSEGLLQQRRATKAELYQSAKLFKLLPSGPNDLWQADVTYLHIPGSGWWYAVTVIDYKAAISWHCTSRRAIRRRRSIRPSTGPWRKPSGGMASWKRCHFW